jgi:hypothetical protein
VCFEQRSLIPCSKGSFDKGVDRWRAHSAQDVRGAALQGIDHQGSEYATSVLFHRYLIAFAGSQNRDALAQERSRVINGSHVSENEAVAVRPQIPRSSQTR